MRDTHIATALVIGGGIVGLSCAFRLQLAGIATQVAEPDGSRSAPCWNNAGHIATEQVEPLASRNTLKSAPSRLFAFGGALDFRAGDPGVLSWLMRFVHASGARRFAAGKQALSQLMLNAGSSWRALVSELGQPDLFIDRGHRVVWESGRSASERRAAWARTDIGNTHFRDLSAHELNAISDRLQRKLAGGIQFENTGQISDPPALFGALRDGIMRMGGRWLEQSVEALVIENGVAQAALADGSRLDPDLIILCAGVRSGALMRGVGHAAPLIAERGYHLQANLGDTDAQAGAASWPDELSPLVFEDRSLIVTRFARALRACSFVEFAAIDSPPDARKWERLARHVAELGLPFGGAPARWMGARPTLPDYLPAIGRSRKAPNLLYAFGHQHLGLTLAPITAEAILSLAMEDAPAFSLAPFDIERFAN